MPSHGKGARARSSLKRWQKHQALLEERHARRVATQSHNMSQEQAFGLVTKRIGWLIDKIQWYRVNSRSCYHLERELESLYWMMDKIKELCTDLLLKQERIKVLEDGDSDTWERDNPTAMATILPSPSSNYLAQSEGARLGMKKVNEYANELEEKANQLINSFMEEE